MATHYFKKMQMSTHSTRYTGYMKNKQDVLDAFVEEFLGYAAELNDKTRKEGSMVPGFNRNVIQIDGEYFLMTLPLDPFYSEIEDMLEASNGNVFSEPVNLNMFRKPHPLMYRCGVSDFWSIFMSGDTTASIAFMSKDACWNMSKTIPYDDHGVSGQFSLKRGSFGWRPMLIPLTRDMKVDHAFMEENVTGSVVYGGCWQVNGKYFGAGDQAVVLTPKSGVSLCDTRSDKKALQWIVWEGFLYCTQNLVMPTVAEIHKRGFVFG